MSLRVFVNEKPVTVARGATVRDAVEALDRALHVKHAKSLEEYLTKYEITLSVMQTAPALERIAYEFVVDAAADGVRYVEVRYSPLLHRPALTLTQAIEAPLAGIRRAEGETGTKVRPAGGGDPPPAARRVARAGAGRRDVPRLRARGVRSRGPRARASGGGASGCVRVRRWPRHGLHLPRRGRGRAVLNTRGAARLRRPAHRSWHAAGRGSGAARLRGRARHPARDVSQQQPPHPHRDRDRGAPLQAVSRARCRRDTQYRRAAGEIGRAHV